MRESAVRIATTEVYKLHVRNVYSGSVYAVGDVKLVTEMKKCDVQV